MRGEGIFLRLHTSEVCLNGCSKALSNSKGLHSSHPAFHLIQGMSIKYKLRQPIIHCLIMPVTCSFSLSLHFQAAHALACACGLHRGPSYKQWKSYLGILKLILCRTSEKSYETEDNLCQAQVTYPGLVCQHSRFRTKEIKYNDDR